MVECIGGCRIPCGLLRTGNVLLVAALAFVMCLAGSCRSRPDLVRVVESKVIDSLLAAAPQTLIDTDALKEEVWLPDGAVAEASDSLALSAMFSFTLARDSLYIADFVGGHIFVAGLEGPLRRRIGHKGAGPLEFYFPLEILFNGTHFFVADASRVQMLTKELSYVGIVPVPGQALAAGLTITGKTSAISHTHLFTPCPKGDANRVCPYDANPPFLGGSSFLPSLGIQEPPMDRTVFKAATEDGTLVMAAFAGLPYIFVFNHAHEHVHTIRFYGSDVKEHAENYAVRQDGVPGVGLSHYWWSLDFARQDLIAASTGNRVYFVRVVNGLHFEHTATVQFKKTKMTENQDGEDSEVALVEGILKYQDHLYLVASQTPHILKYRVNL